MEAKNKNTLNNFDPIVLKNMILFALKSKKISIIEKDFLKHEQNETTYEYLVHLFLDEVNRVIMIKPLKKYVFKNEDLYYIKGKINIKETKTHNFNDKVRCIYDEMTLDNKLNRIVKFIVYYLLGDKVICKNKTLKKRLIDVYYYFKDVKLVDIKISDVDGIKFDNNNINYEMLLLICKYILGCIKSDSHKRKYIDINSMLWWVYQEFIRNYYDFKKEDMEIQSVSLSETKHEWNLEPKDGSDISLLPSMRTDIELEKEDEHIIIDAKCYETSLMKFHNKKMFIPSNLYQLKSYLDIYRFKNKDKKRLRGILIYPFNDKYDLNAGRQVFYDEEYDYTLEIVTINFKQSWEDVCAKLNQLV